MRLPRALRRLRYWQLRRLVTPGLWWLYTPHRFTAYFHAGGWVALSPTWLWEKLREEHKRRRRMITSRA